jgi:hypothetical protein
MQTINNLVSNPGVAVLLGVVVSTLGTTVGAYLTSRLEERRMDREDQRQRKQWEREEKERQRQEASASEEERTNLYAAFVFATDVKPSTTYDEEVKVNRLYFQIAMVAPNDVSKAARELRSVARRVLNMSEEVYYDDAQSDPLFRQLEDAREKFLAAIRGNPAS